MKGLVKHYEKKFIKSQQRNNVLEERISNLEETIISQNKQIVSLMSDIIDLKHENILLKEHQNITPEALADIKKHADAMDAFASLLNVSGMFKNIARFRNN